MRKLVSSVGVAFGALFAALPAAAKDDATVSLEARGPWQINFAEDKCQLARKFVRGKNEHVLIFEQHGPGSSFSLTVSGPAFSKFTGNKPISIQFDERGEPQELSGFKGELEPFGDALIFNSLWLEKAERAASQFDDNEQPGLAAIDLSTASGLENVTIAQKNRKIRLLSGKLAKPLSALNACSEDLVRAWGFDPEKQKTRVKAPTWKNVMYVTKRIQETYPTDAVRVGEQGIFNMRVTVDADGTVSDCTLLGLTEQKRLQSPACGIIKRSAEFDPAVDQDGKPMRSYYSTSIIYRVG